MKWLDKKEELEQLIIVEGKSYEEIGRLYGCSGSNIKKTAKRLGIEIQSRRKINEKETFNKGTAKTGICQNCGKTIILYESTNGKYCSIKCQREKEYKDYIERWKNGEENGLKSGFCLSEYVRRYIFDKYDCRCDVCKNNYINPYTGKSVLQIHHINGNCLDTNEDNLVLLCPTHHAMTENYCRRNKNAAKGRTEYFDRHRNRKNKGNVQQGSKTMDNS